MDPEKKKDVHTWLYEVDWKAPMEADVIPKPEVDNLSLKSSRSSKQSGGLSVISQLATERAKKAALLAKAKIIEESQNIKKEQLLLDLRREQLELQTELSMTQAREAVYEEFSFDISIPHADRDLKFKPSNTQPHNLSSPVSEMHEPHDFVPVENYVPLSKPQSINVTPSHLATGSNNKDNAASDPIQKLLEKQTALTESLIEHQNKTLIPIPKVSVFKGDLLQYKASIKSFENRIEKRICDPSDRLYYLDQLTDGEPNSLVRSCLHMEPAAGYAKARELLDRIFGDDYKIAVAYSETLLKWPTMRPENVALLAKFSLKLTSCLNAVNEVKNLDHMNHPQNLKDLMNKLPFNMRDRFRAKVQRIKTEQQLQIKFEDFLKFIETEVETITDPIFGRASDVNSTPQTNKPTGRPTFYKPGYNVAAASFANQPTSQQSYSQRYMLDRKKFQCFIVKRMDIL